MGGTSKTTQTTTNAPYPAAGRIYDKTMADTLKLYEGGNLVKPLDMSTVVPYSDQTKQAMGGLESLGKANTGGQGLSGQYQNIINGGGFTGDQQTALGGIRDTATGSFDLSANPAFQQILSKAQGDTINAVNQNAAGMGRYGSGTHEGVTAREVGNLTADMVGKEYNNWQNRRDAAQTQLFNAGQQGQANLGSAYEGLQSSYNPLLQVGQMNEDLAGRTLNDKLRIAQEKANAPLANLQAANAIAGGAGGFGTGTATAQGPSNSLSNALGAGLGGASLLSGGGKKL